MSVAAPWMMADFDPDRVVAELRRRFPMARAAWWGEFTGSWWALVTDRRGRVRLVEAASPAALGRRLEAMDARRPYRPRTVRGGRVRGAGRAARQRACPSSVPGRHKAGRRWFGLGWLGRWLKA